MTVSKRQLAAATRTAAHLAERERLAAFIDDEATSFAPNPFARTSVAVAMQRWSREVFEFKALDVAFAGLDCLLRSLRALPRSQPLQQEILKAGPHTLYLYHLGDGCHVVGAALYGQPGVALPTFARPAVRRRPRLEQDGQPDLFAVNA